LLVQDTTSNVLAAISSQATNSFTFASTSAHVYTYLAAGA
jgi:hypothetical protein